MVAAASGCCAIDERAMATALPWPKAGPMQPMPIVMPAVMIDAVAIQMALSMSTLFCGDSCGGRDVNRSQDTKDVGLDHACQETQCRHQQRKQQGRDGQQYGDDHCATHHVAEDAHRESQ